ncbi:MAG: GDYXXLXY domain-containing protein [Deltaproteobacteria bacterium]|nr:GDYXXLXY domain-containing protein [Deltaproteobacteria bacterium]
MTATVRRVVVLALPVVVLAAMVLRAEVIIAQGRHYVLDIEGYDPRDLLRGQYLRFRVRWSGGFGGACTPGEEGCCVCFGENAEPDRPWVHHVACTEMSACQAFINPESARTVNQYFIPEDMGGPLERAIREKRATIRVAVSSRGEVIIEDLLLDGQPWRDVVGRPPPSE